MRFLDRAASPRHPHVRWLQTIRFCTDLYATARDPADISNIGFDQHGCHSQAERN